MTFGKHNSSAKSGRELIKGLKDSASLVVHNKKNFWLRFTDFL